MPAGRPTKYRDDMPGKVRAWLSEGYSKTACAAKLGVSKETFYVWANELSDFSDAIKQGEAASELWWEDKCRDMAANGEIAPALMIFVLKTRFGYKETNTLELTGKDGGAIETKSKVLNVVGVSPDGTRNT